MQLSGFEENNSVIFITTCFFLILKYGKIKIYRNLFNPGLVTVCPGRVSGLSCVWDKWALRASWHRPTAGQAFPGILVSQDRQLWTMAGASPHMDEGKGWDQVHQQAAEPQLSLQMETVLHTSTSAPTERTLLKAVPGSQDVGVVPIQILPSLPILSITSLGCPLFHLKEKVWFSVSRLLCEQSRGNCTLPGQQETQETAAQCL